MQKLFAIASELLSNKLRLHRANHSMCITKHTHTPTRAHRSPFKVHLPAFNSRRACQVPVCARHIIKNAKEGKTKLCSKIEALISQL